MEKKIKHLELIEGIINRMSSNSFMLKGWAVTLAAGIFAISAKDTDKMYFLVAYIPITVFWFLDAYYLKQERLYRNLFDIVRNKNEDDIDFSLNTGQVTLEHCSSYIACLFSKTECSFYIPLAVLCSLIVVITC